MGPMRDPKPRGSLWVYDTAQDQSTPREIQLVGYPDSHNFHPIGLDIEHASESKTPSNLFVINHGAHNSTIEQFRMSITRPTEATYVRTITHRGLVAPNSLALTSPTSFIVSNDHYFTRRMSWPFNNVLPLLETVLSLPLGWLSYVHVDETSGDVQLHDIATGISFPNGVAISPTGDTIAISATTLSQVQIYTIKKTSHVPALALSESIDVPFTPDNLSFDDEGALIVAGHPHFPSLLSVAARASLYTHAPSWILSVRNTSSGSSDNAPVPVHSRVTVSANREIKTLYQSSGKHFSTSTTGLVDSRSGKLYSVGLYQTGLLICQQK